MKAQQSVRSGDFAETGWRNQLKFQVHVITVDLIWNAAPRGCGVHRVLQGML